MLWALKMSIIGNSVTMPRFLCNMLNIYPLLKQPRSKKNLKLLGFLTTSALQVDIVLINFL